MAVAVGDKLGSYEILASIGAGAMGVVYRARDTRLKREVALKVLPDAFAADPERMARFEREARVLASLNHPNIAQIYGVETRTLVMELVTGESPKGPMAFDDAWKIAAHILLGGLRRLQRVSAAGDAGGEAAISPDGKQLVGDRGGTWLLEFARGVATRLTFGQGNENPIWSPDSRYVAYSKFGEGIIGSPPMERAPGSCWFGRTV